MVWINLLLNEGDLIQKLKLKMIPIQRKQFKDLRVLREKLVKLGYSLLYIRYDTYLAELSSNISETNFNESIRHIKEFSDTSGYFETEETYINVTQNLWDVIIPNLIYSSIFFNIYKIKPEIIINFQKKRIYSPKIDSNREGIRIKTFQVDKNNFALSIDCFKSIPSNELSDPRKLLKPKIRKDKIERIISHIFGDIETFDFFLGGNKLSIKFKEWIT